MIGRNFTVRLAPDEADLVEQIAADRGASSAEVLRDALRVYFQGASGLKGADAGYVAGKSLASQIAFESLREALEGVPSDHGEALAWLAKRRGKKR